MESKRLESVISHLGHIGGAAVLAVALSFDAAAMLARSRSTDKPFAMPLSRSAVRITCRQFHFPLARKDAAVRALAALKADPESPVAANSSDHDLLPARFDRVTPFDMSRVFGAAFAEAIQKLPVKRWSGPVRSDVGWHIVWVDSVSSAQTQESSAIDNPFR